MNKTKTTLMTTALLLALLVLVPAPAQADPINEAATTVKQTQYTAVETADDALGSIEESAVHLRGWGSEAMRCSTELPAGPCSHPGNCDEDPNYPNCEYRCYGEGPGTTDECRRTIYCESNPAAHPCTGQTTRCSDGFYGWNTDGDDYCDRDDLDDDGDGVPDTEDPSPRANNAVDDAYSCVSWFLNTRNVCSV